jgi:hypothetical protein
MIRIAITTEAFAAIEATSPRGSIAFEPTEGFREDIDQLVEVLSFTCAQYSVNVPKARRNEHFATPDRPQDNAERIAENSVHTNVLQKFKNVCYAKYSRTPPGGKIR